MNRGLRQVKGGQLGVCAQLSWIHREQGVALQLQVAHVGQATERIRDRASEAIGLEPEVSQCSERSDGRGKRTSQGIALEMENGQCS